LFVDSAILHWIRESASGEAPHGWYHEAAFGFQHLVVPYSARSLCSKYILQPLHCTHPHLDSRYGNHLGTRTIIASTTIGSMSVDTTTDASSAVAVAERVSHNSTPSAGLKRKFGDEVVGTSNSGNEEFDQLPRPLKKVRSPSYVPTSESVRKPGDSVLGKRQREDLDTNDVDNEESNQAQRLLKKARSSSEGVREAGNAILDENQRDCVPWDDLSHVPAHQREQVKAIFEGVVRGIEHLKGESDAIYKTKENVEVTEEEARKAEKAAFVKMALGIKDPAPLMAAPVNNIDPHRADRPIWQHGRPARSLFFAKRGDVDRPDQKHVNRRVNFEEDDEVRDPSVYRNPLTKSHPSLREMREKRARQRTAADIAEHEADLAAVRKAREQAEAEGLTPAESITKAATAKNIKKSSKADKGQQRKETTTPKKDSKASKEQQNKDTNTLSPKSSTANNGKSKDTPINLDDDAGVHNSPLAQTTGAERIQKPKEGKHKKLQRAERAQKKKERKDKIAAWSTAAQSEA